ncbi:MAG TPA: hypothetical protein VFQ70_02145 [Candidatus Saccharimonadaceae bacterium]|nr:hypothetical protein [Candidatus Saccharimonadaceae bacterium]
MIIAGSRLLDAPVMGLQTGSELARTTRAIVDPATLAIVAYEITGALIGDANLLRVADVREFSNLGLIVDSQDEFVAPEDVIKLHEIYELGFEPLGMPVTDEKRSKLGKVNSYTIETTTFTIQQLSVRRPLLKSLGDTELLIHRSQIIEINDKSIVVHSKAEIPEPRLEQIRTSYVNPFRKAEPGRIDRNENS